MPGPVQYYVDPAINANSGTGTIGDPFGDLQYALNNITRSTTVGDQINIKAGTAEFPSGAITLATYGTSPTKLIFRGYTSAANDGGKFEINYGGANVNFFAGTYSNLAIIDGKLWNNGTGVANFGGNSVVIDSCEIITNGLTLGGINCLLKNSKITGLTNFSGVVAGGIVVGNWIESSATGSFAYAVYQNGSPAYIADNIIICKHVQTSGVYLLCNQPTGSFCANNTIFSEVSSTKFAIDLTSTTTNNHTVSNNIIQGFSGVGGGVIRSNPSNTRNTGTIRANRWFNCTSGVTTTDADVITDNSVLSESPFIDAAGYDFRIKPAVQGIGFPPNIYGIANTNKYVDLGALQSQSTGGTSGFTGIRGLSRRLGT